MTASFLGRPVINVENACASGPSAFHLAYAQVTAGLYEVSLAVGAEKLSYPDNRAILAAIPSGTDVNDIDRLRERPGGDPNGSIFMDVYADSARRMIERYGATPADFAAVTSRAGPSVPWNEIARFRTPMTVEEVLSMRSVAGPLALPMCSTIADGAAALVVVSPDQTKRRGLAAVTVEASVVTTGLDGQDVPVPTARAACRAYERAGSHFETSKSRLAVHSSLSPAASSVVVGEMLVNGREQRLPWPRTAVAGSAEARPWQS
ncbi:hypothetical protein ACWD4O_43965 [Streptomyces sp. NPDC002623]